MPTGQPPKARKPKPTSVLCPFTVAVDTREQRAYTFQGLTSNVKEGSLPIEVRIARVTLPTGRGDYSIVEFPGVAIERKSKQDLYGSVATEATRANFERRMLIMQTDRERTILSSAHVVVEAEPFDLLANPPSFTAFNPKSLWRTILSWQIRYPLIHWHFLWDREAAEAQTFRLLEKTWNHFGPDRLNTQKLGP